MTSEQNSTEQNTTPEIEHDPATVEAHIRRFARRMSFRAGIISGEGTAWMTWQPSSISTAMCTSVPTSCASRRSQNSLWAATPRRACAPTTAGVRSRQRSAVPRLPAWTRPTLLHQAWTERDLADAQDRPAVLASRIVDNTPGTPHNSPSTKTTPRGLQRTRQCRRGLPIAARSTHPTPSPSGANT